MSEYDIVTCIPKKKHSPRDREIWFVNSTFAFHLDRAKINQHAKYPDHSSFHSTVIVRTQTQTDTYTGPAAAPGPLKAVKPIGSETVLQAQR